MKLESDASMKSCLMSDILPSPLPCNKVLPPAPSLHTTSRPLASHCSNHSYTHAASDPLPLKRLRTSSSSHTPPRTCPARAAAGPLRAASAAHTGRVPVAAAAACASPQSDACAPSQGSQQKVRAHFAPQRRPEEAVHINAVNELLGGALPEDMMDATSTLPRLLAQYGSGPPVPAANDMGVFGQAILVASRLGAYSRAAWELLVESGGQGGSVGPDSPPLARYCDSLKALIRHSILQRVEALHGSARDSKSAACSLLQHVLLWQYLKHRNIMGLVELALEHEAAGGAADGQLSARGARRRMPFDPDDNADASGSCFLTELGIPLVKEAMEQANTGVHLRESAEGGLGPHSPAQNLATLDFASVLAMIFQSARMRSPSCTDSAVTALAGETGALHRVAHFLTHHHGLLTQILSGVDHTPQQLLLLYMGLTHASALLSKDAPGPIAAEAAPAVIAAHEAIARYNASADECQRAAKAAILDARISAARSAAWNKDVAACSVKAAVSKAFREAYLFAELKELLQMWTPMLDSVLDSELLSTDSALDAQATAASAFDISPVGLRFRVPSAGFLLIWTTAPLSPAHAPQRHAAAGGPVLRRVPSDGAAAARKRHPASQRPTRSDDVLVQVGRPPVVRPHSTKAARRSLDETRPPLTATRPHSKIGDMGPPPDVPEGWHGAKRARGTPVVR
eukprot:jgi/Ulvmu1/2381/UM130_0014.1